MLQPNSVGSVYRAALLPLIIIELPFTYKALVKAFHGDWTLLRNRIGPIVLTSDLEHRRDRKRVSFSPLEHSPQLSFWGRTAFSTQGTSSPGEGSAKGYMVTQVRSGKTLTVWQKGNTNVT